MTQQEREKMIDDKWPTFSKKEKAEFSQFVKEASKANIFDIEECQCDKDKRPVPC